MAWSTESRQSRGYGAEWDKIRLVVIERDCGLCQACKRNGRVAVGKSVDHIVSKAKAAKLGWTQAQTDAVSNLEYLCKPCHDRKSAEEVGKAYRPPVRYGEDGWPIE